MTRFIDNALAMCMALFITAAAFSQALTVPQTDVPAFAPGIGTTILA